MGFEMKSIVVHELNKVDSGVFVGGTISMMFSGT